MDDGWTESAAAWLAEIGTEGDYGRRFVLDAPMLARVEGRGFRTALDVGCGEGRFCRALARLGVHTVGIDPTASLLDRARALDPGGDYRLCTAEAFRPDRTFDLVVSYLTLIDIPDFRAALATMAGALRPGGTLLIANLNSFVTAGMPDGWTDGGDGVARFSIDGYLEERANHVSWRGISVVNWHRPLGATMAACLSLGLTLTHFAEPAPYGGPAEKAERYRRVPYFHVMEWRKGTE